MKTKNWRNIRARKFSPAGLTQEALAQRVEITQSQLSKLERRDDHRLSTLRRYVTALGGTLEVIAVVGGRRIRLSEV